MEARYWYVSDCATISFLTYVALWLAHWVYHETRSATIVIVSRVERTTKKKSCHP